MFTKEMLIDSIEIQVAQPLTEVFHPEFGFHDYRISWGVKCHLPATVLFLAVYPAFCTAPKMVIHYPEQEADTLVADINAILTYNRAAGDEQGVKLSDIVAVALALHRNKESIELYQEQKDLMEFGLSHIHLSNFYQDRIKQLCAEYYAANTILGQPLVLSFVHKSEVSFG